MPQEKGEHHPKFYFNDGNVIFLVENTLFKVHRYFFERDSPIFNAMFSLPRPQQEPAVTRRFIEEDTPGSLTEVSDKNPDNDLLPILDFEGESDDNPIFLTGFKAEDFECLLEIMYPADFYVPTLISLSQWVSVLEVSSRFEFLSIRHLSIHQLYRLISDKPIDLIVLGKRFDMPEWLVMAYKYLCIREQPLSVEEGKKLGLEDVIAIGNVRQSIRYPANLNRHSDSISELVRQTFIDGAG